jgi:hypothetical protein
VAPTIRTRDLIEQLIKQTSPDLGQMDRRSCLVRFSARAARAWHFRRIAAAQTRCSADHEMRSRPWRARRRGRSPGPFDSISTRPSPSGQLRHRARFFIVGADLDVIIIIASIVIHTDMRWSSRQMVAGRHASSRASDAPAERTSQITPSVDLFSPCIVRMDG